MSLFFREILTPTLKCRGVSSGGCIAAVFFIGLLQSFFWLVFVIRPDIAQYLFKLDDFQGHSIGFLAAVFFTLSSHGFYLVGNANTVNHSIVPAAVFYRIVFNIPVFIFGGPN